MPNFRPSIQIGVFALLFSLIGGCTQHKSTEGDPKKRVQDYISDSFNMKGLEGRKTLESYLTGEARSRLAAWSDEQFKKAFIESRRQFIKLVFKDLKTVSPKEVHLTYELTYMDQVKGEASSSSDAKITAKKICELTREGDSWFIKEVRNIKELVEYKNELSLP